MRPLGVVIIDLAREDRARMADREEQRLVERLIAHATVEAFYEPVRRWLPRRDMVPPDAGIARPRQNHVRGEPGAVVAGDHLGTHRTR